MGIAFDVNEEVLIPRSDTEILVESVLGDVQAAATTGRNFRILDLCCGSGVIGLSLAANLPDCRVVLADISEAAVGLARANLAKIAGGAATPALKKVALKQGDLLAPFKGRFRTEKFDIIATNPPYIPSAEIAALEPEVNEHEPKLALDGGPKSSLSIGAFCVKRRLICAPEANCIWKSVRRKHPKSNSLRRKRIFMEAR